MSGCLATPVVWLTKPIFPSISPWRLFRLRVRFWFLFVGLLSAFVASVLIQDGRYEWAFWVALAAIASSLFELVVGDLWARRRYPASTQTLLERLEINFDRVNQHVPEFVRQLIDSLRGCDSARVSGTVHLRVPLYTVSGDSEEALVQLTGYTGAGGRPWRFTPASKGIIGRCLRTKRQESVSFASEAEYRVRMVSDFGFLPAEAGAHTTTARSYLAQPIVAGGTLVGVLYLFSTEPQAFPYAVDTKALETAASNIAAFLEGAVTLSELRSR